MSPIVLSATGTSALKDNHHAGSRAIPQPRVTDQMGSSGPRLVVLRLLLAVLLTALPGCDNRTQSYPPPADAATRDAILRAVFGDSNFTLLGPTGRKEYPGLDRDKVFRTVIEHARAAGFTGRPDSMSGHVVSLLRYPLKSARGEQLRAVRVDVEGVRSGRGWAWLDEADGTVGSAKHPDRWGRLLGVTAQVDEHSSEVVVQVQGLRAVAGSEQADALLSEHLGRPVRLTQSVPDQARLHRRLPEEQGLVRTG